MSYLKTKAVKIEGMAGESLTLSELPAIAQIEIMVAQGKTEEEGLSYNALFIACRYGVVGWADSYSIDQIKQIITLKQANAIAAEVMKLSGIGDDGPNSEGNPS